MTFGEAIKYCFGHLFDFKGRARRSEFWWFYLFMNLVVSVVVLIIMAVMFAALIPLIAESSTGSPDESVIAASLGITGLMYVLIFVVAIVSSVLMLGVNARRLHDMGQSAHWLWLYLVNLSIVPIIMAIMEGQPHANQWGPDPKAAQNEAPALP